MAVEPGRFIRASRRNARKKRSRASLLNESPARRRRLGARPVPGLLATLCELHQGVNFGTGTFAGVPTFTASLVTRDSLVSLIDLSVQTTRGFAREPALKPRNPFLGVGAVGSLPARGSLESLPGPILPPLASAGVASARNPDPHLSVTPSPAVPAAGGGELPAIQLHKLLLNAQNALKEVRLAQQQQGQPGQAQHVLHISDGAAPSALDNAELELLQVVNALARAADSPEEKQPQSQPQPQPQQRQKRPPLQPHLSGLSLAAQDAAMATSGSGAEGDSGFDSALEERLVTPLQFEQQLPVPSSVASPELRHPHAQRAVDALSARVPRRLGAKSLGGAPAVSPTVYGSALPRGVRLGPALTPEEEAAASLSRDNDGAGGGSDALNFVMTAEGKLIPASWAPPEAPSLSPASHLASSSGGVGAAGSVLGRPSLIARQSVSFADASSTAAGGAAAAAAAGAGAAGAGTGVILAQNADTHAAQHYKSAVKELLSLVSLLAIAYPVHNAHGTFFTGGAAASAGQLARSTGEAALYAGLAQKKDGSGSGSGVPESPNPAAAGVGGAGSATSAAVGAASRKGKAGNKQDDTRIFSPAVAEAFELAAAQSSGVHGSPLLQSAPGMASPALLHEFLLRARSLLNADSVQLHFRPPGSDYLVLKSSTRSAMAGGSHAAAVAAAAGRRFASLYGHQAAAAVATGVGGGGSEAAAGADDDLSGYSAAAGGAGGSVDGEYGVLGEGSAEQRVGLGCGVVGACARAGKTIRVRFQNMLGNTQVSTRAVGASQAATSLSTYSKGSPKAVMCVPLLSPTNRIPFAVLEVMNTQNHGFSITDERLAEVCAQLLAQALWTVELHEIAAQEQVKSSRLFTATNMLMGTVNMGAFLAVLSELAREAAGAIAAEVFYVEQMDPAEIVRRQRALRMADGDAGFSSKRRHGSDVDGEEDDVDADHDGLAGGGESGVGFGGGGEGGAGATGLLHVSKLAASRRAERQYRTHLVRCAEASDSMGMAVQSAISERATAVTGRILGGGQHHHSLQGGKKTATSRLPTARRGQGLVGGSSSSSSSSSSMDRDTAVLEDALTASYLAEAATTTSRSMTEAAKARAIRTGALPASAASTSSSAASSSSAGGLAGTAKVKAGGDTESDRPTPKDEARVPLRHGSILSRIVATSMSCLACDAPLLCCSLVSCHYCCLAHGSPRRPPPPPPPPPLLPPLLTQARWQ